MPLPIEIIGLNRPTLTIVWDEGHEAVYAAHELRLRCACAHCVHEITGAALLDPKTVPADVTITALELAGNYGLRVTFSDRHDTGIFRFADLLRLCPCDACRAKDG
jgi:DUF971 family protein